MRGHDGSLLVEEGEIIDEKDDIREKHEEKKKRGKMRKKKRRIFSETILGLILSPRGARSRGKLLSSLDGKSGTMKPLHVHQHTLQQSMYVYVVCIVLRKMRRPCPGKLFLRGTAGADKANSCLLLSEST